MRYFCYGYHLTKINANFNSAFTTQHRTHNTLTHSFAPVLCDYVRFITMIIRLTSSVFLLLSWRQADEEEANTGIGTNAETFKRLLKGCYHLSAGELAGL